MIELGLTRISALLRNRSQPWKAIHVAGTNGKGSICAYITAMLRAGGVRCGRFTSPHLIDRWDCINIDGKPITYDAFKAHEEHFMKRNQDEKIGASEFELLTACAFEAFTASNVQVGVVEVGMGGRLDATNVIEKPLITVIAKIGLDHQAFLGDTIEAIAREKAGILKPGVPCVVNGNNQASVLEVIKSAAEEVGAGPVVLKRILPKLYKPQKDAWTPRWGQLISTWDQFIDKMRDKRSQRENIACALEAVKLALPQLELPEPVTGFDLLPAVFNHRLPGRLQTVDISPLVGQKQEILLDGAHNVDSAAALNVVTFSTYRKMKHVKGSSRKGNYIIGGIRDDYREGTGVTWVLAFTDGKDVKAILQAILRPFDSVFLTHFSPVDGMPWVKPMQPANIEATIKEAFPDVAVHHGGDVQQALQAASRFANGGPMVVAGSLYLVSDVLRLLPDVHSTDSTISTKDQKRLKRLQKRGLIDADGNALPKRPRGRPRKNAL